MNLPNRLTIARLIITMIFVAVMSLPTPNKYTVGLLLFAVASFTDFLDGYIARKYHLVTTFGKLMDPLADKILTGATFILLASEEMIAAWMVVVIISREFLVTGLRLVAADRGHVLSADWMGKWKTILQIATSLYLLWFLAATREPLLGWSHQHLDKLWVGFIGHLLIWVTIFLTLYSGINYLWKNRILLKDT